MGGDVSIESAGGARREKGTMEKTTTEYYSTQ